MLVVPAVPVEGPSKLGFDLPPGPPPPEPPAGLENPVPVPVLFPPPPPPAKYFTDGAGPGVPLDPAKIGETKKTIARLKTILKGKLNA